MLPLIIPFIYNNGKYKSKIQFQGAFVTLEYT